MKREFWVQMSEEGEYGNPTDICWAYYPSDKPTEGVWIKVVEIIEDEEHA